MGCSTRVDEERGKGRTQRAELKKRTRYRAAGLCRLANQSAMFAEQVENQHAIVRIRSHIRTQSRHERYSYVARDYHYCCCHSKADPLLSGVVGHIGLGLVKPGGMQGRGGGGQGVAHDRHNMRESPGSPSGRRNTRVRGKGDISGPVQAAREREHDPHAARLDDIDKHHVCVCAVPGMHHDSHGVPQRICHVSL